MMKHDMIKFNEKMELQIVEDCGEEFDYAPATCSEVFEPNQMAAGEIVSKDNGLADIQYGIQCPTRFVCHFGSWKQSSITLNNSLIEK